MTANLERPRKAPCGCIGWLCALCGKLAWSCREGGADDYPEFCDRCFCAVLDAGESVLPDGPMPAEPTVEMLEAETLEIMRRLVRLESRRAPLEGTN